MKSKKNYLKFLNDNYFFEIGYTKKESKLKNNKTINKWNIQAILNQFLKRKASTQKMVH
jgi:transposase